MIILTRKPINLYWRRAKRKYKGITYSSVVNLGTKISSKRRFTNVRMPKSLIQNKKSFSDLLKDVDWIPRDVSMIEDPEKMIISKMPNSAQGKGHLIMKAKEITPDMIVSRNNQELIDPLLLDNKKFSVRMLFIWIQGKGARLCFDGVVFACSQPYNANDFSSHNQLTNSHIHHQRNPPSFLEASDRIFDTEDKKNKFHFGLKKMVKEFYLHLNERVDIKENPKNFDLYGVDIMGDKFGKSYMIEANTQWTLNGRNKSCAIKIAMFDKAMKFLKSEQPYPDCYDFIEHQKE